ncbi:MAG: tRNA (adenosine(37)-N6)-threonylcarbamoyltransferase complex transferase subunit TsaD [Armatimonadetes bacterium]|nr:tRNA (adenosine(37)-N6)-threonylcarbamoyltransferase complex transferase subunit TsaD [Armatimonadota bacterium]
MTVLGLETSCDETSAAVVRDGMVLSSLVASQADLHARWGGVVPEVASRRHLERVLPVIDEALEAAGLRLGDLSGIAVTNRPGLAGALVVGVAAAKALAAAMDVALIGVNHLHGHLSAGAHAGGDLRPPYAALLVSGGHTELIYVTANTEYLCMGRTRDDAAGECLDKCARVMGLPYPGGPHVERLARAGRQGERPLPRAWLGDSLDFSFSGLKTAVLRRVEAGLEPARVPGLCAALQESVVDVLVRKSVRAATRAGVSHLVLGGGVTANRALVDAATQAGARAGVTVVAPPLDLCTDNAAMIALHGLKLLRAGLRDGLGLDVLASDPIPRMAHDWKPPSSASV